MDKTSTYNLVSRGELQPGFQLAEVQTAFAGLFKVQLAQAQKLVGCKAVIKKNLDYEKAELYKKRLESIGMVVRLMPTDNQPVVSLPTTLALEPIDTPVQNTAVSAPVVQSGQQVCPKCGLEQAPGNECRGCGIFFDKYFAKIEASSVSGLDSPASNGARVYPGAARASAEVVEGAADSVEAKALVAAAVAAIAGALVWKLIATVFNYELGIIAWGIGGLVGFAAAKLGSRGDVAGALCGVLALLAILGGKYMVVDGYKSEIANILSAEYGNDIFLAAYEESTSAAKAYVANVDDEASLRQFMVAHEYTDETTPSAISAEEVALFKEYSAPILEQLAYDGLSMEDWKASTFDAVQTGIDDISTFDLMKEDFSWIDLLFYFLGVSTAFRLGRG